jgi:nicotinamidase-related amidase
MGYAVLVVDMINEFVTGSLGSPGAVEVVSGIGRLLTTARENKVPVIYLTDAHRPEDSELNVWGEHAMLGTSGSEIVSGLSPEPEDIILRKQVYSGFYKSDLEETLKQLEVDSVIFTGVSTDICVQNNVADAFYRGFKLFVVTDGTAAIKDQVHESALVYMKNIYGANLINLEESFKLIKEQG